MGINAPEISIILPSFRMEKHLKNALDDIVSQTYSDWEAIVVDDCSDDGTKDIALEYANKDSRIKLISHEINKGLSSSRNTGLKAACGKYILFLDPDDRYENTLLESIHTEIEIFDPDIIVYSLSEEYDGGNSFVHSLSDSRISDSKTLHHLVAKMESETLLGYAWNKAYKKALLDRSEAKFINIKHIEDILFNLHVLRFVERMSVISTPLYHYSNGGVTGLTAKYLPDYFDLQKRRVNEFIELYKFWDDLDDHVLMIASSVYFRSFISYMERELSHDTNKSDILLRAESELKDPMFIELSKHIPEGKMTRFLFVPLSQGKIKNTFFKVRLISMVKRYFPFLFNALKQNR